MSAERKQLKAEMQNMLYQALAEPVGLLLRASDANKARTFLYGLRSEIGDPDLSCLQFRMVDLRAEEKYKGMDLGSGPQIAIVKGSHFPVPEHRTLSLLSSPDLGELDL